MILLSTPQSELMSDSMISHYAPQSSESIEQKIEKELN